MLLHVLMDYGASCMADTSTPQRTSTFVYGNGRDRHSNNGQEGEYVNGRPPDSNGLPPLPIHPRGAHEQAALASLRDSLAEVMSPLS
jgi:hypothetical protein